MSRSAVQAAVLSLLLLVPINIARGASARGSEGLYSVDSDVPPIVFPDLPDNYALSDIAGRLGVSVDDMKQLMVGRRGTLSDFELRDIKTFGQLKDFVNFHTSAVPGPRGTLRYNWYQEHGYNKFQEVMMKMGVTKQNLKAGAIGLASALAGAGLSYLASDGSCTWADGRCGGCRSFYGALFTASPDHMYKGPLLKRDPVTCDWGAQCKAWDEAIAPVSVGVGKLGSSPRSMQTGLECDVRYVVHDVSGVAIDCAIRMNFNNPFWSGNEYSGKLEGKECPDTLKLEQGPYVGGDTASIEYYLYFEEPFARIGRASAEAAGFDVAGMIQGPSSAPLASAGESSSSAATPAEDVAASTAAPPSSGAPASSFSLAGVTLAVGALLLA